MQNTSMIVSLTMAEALKIAVVGHTNVGKTSLMRTLTRRADFGEVASSPATTRHVEKASLRVSDGRQIDLFDTPGLEDSEGLRAHLEARIQESGLDWVETIVALTSQDGPTTSFAQESKALRQVLASDVLLYVVDARDKVRAKHRDELEILMRCARPIVAVLNFGAQSAEGEESWRAQLARANIHAIARFDTVAYSLAAEISLYEKVRTLLDSRADLINQIISDTRSARSALETATAAMIGDMLAELSRAQEVFPAEDAQARDAAAIKLKQRLRDVESAYTRNLLKLHRFAQDDYVLQDMPLEQGVWCDDPFDADVLKDFGFSTGRAAATGAAVGLGIDLMVGGITLGAAAASGAVVGAALDIVRKHGGWLQEKMSGTARLHIEQPSLHLIAARQIALAKTLLQRGHGADGRIVHDLGQEISPDLEKALLRLRRDSAESRETILTALTDTLKSG